MSENIFESQRNSGSPTPVKSIALKVGTKVYQGLSWYVGLGSDEGQRRLVDVRPQDTSSPEFISRAETLGRATLCASVFTGAVLLHSAGVPLMDVRTFIHESTGL